MRKLLLGVLFVIVLIIDLMAEEAKPLVVGMELSYPPFEMISRTGEPEGISVEMAQELALWLKRPLKIENIPFVGLIPSLKTEKIDLIISSLSITPQRRKAIDFSEPYLENGLCLLVNINSPVNSIEDLNHSGMRVVVKQGTSGEVYAHNFLKEVKVLVLDTESACVLEVVQQKADAFIYDQFSVFTQWQRNQGTTRALLTPFHKEYWAIGVRKGDEALLKQINAFLEEFKKKKEFERLGEKYLPEHKKAFKEKGIPFFL